MVGQAVQNEQGSAAQHQALQQQRIQQQQAAAQAAQQATQHQIAQQAAQMAQQMLQQQQPQQPQMLVAFPEWNRQDAESHISQLNSALHANGQAGILTSLSGISICC